MNSNNLKFIQWNQHLSIHKVQAHTCTKHMYKHRPLQTHSKHTWQTCFFPPLAVCLATWYRYARQLVHSWPHWGQLNESLRERLWTGLWTSSFCCEANSLPHTWVCKSTNTLGFWYFKNAFTTMFYGCLSKLKFWNQVKENRFT